MRILRMLLLLTLGSLALAACNGRGDMMAPSGTPGSNSDTGHGGGGY